MHSGRIQQQQTKQVESFSSNSQFSFRVENRIVADDILDTIWIPWQCYRFLNDKLKRNRLRGWNLLSLIKSVALLFELVLNSDLTGNQF